MSTVDLTPRRPSRGFTTAVRGGAVLALAIVVLRFWQTVLTPGASSAAPFLGLVVGLAAAVATTTAWVSAAKPRLSGDQQHVVTAALTDADRRVVSRALRRGDPPPVGLEPWAVPYAHIQAGLTLGACLMLLTSAMVVTSAAGQPLATAWNWTYLAVAAVVAAMGAGLVWWTRRAERVARRWARSTSLSDPAPRQTP